MSEDRASYETDAAGLIPTSQEIRPNSPTESDSVSMKRLQEILQERGVVITYTALSDLISEGDVAEQLGVPKGRARKTFGPAVVDILAQFIPAFRDAGGKLPQAPAMLRGFVNSLKIPQTALNGPALALVPARPSVPPDPLAVAEVQGRAQGWGSQDRVMTAKEAADFLHISTAMLRKTVRPFRRFGNSARGDRWRMSDLLSAEEKS